MARRIQKKHQPRLWLSVYWEERTQWGGAPQERTLLLKRLERSDWDVHGPRFWLREEKPGEREPLAFRAGPLEVPRMTKEGRCI